MMHGNLGSFSFMGIGMLAAIILIILFFFLISNKEQKNNQSIQEILDEKYATGKINLEEYHKQSKKIKKD